MYRILLVEDDDALRYVYRKLRAFKENGFVIAAEAVNGKEALDLLQNDRFDLIVTDIRMPLVDGLALLREMKVRGLDTPAVLVSSYDEFEYARQGLILGAFDYIVKPVGESSLSAMLARVAVRFSRQGGAGADLTLVRAALTGVGIDPDGDTFVRALCAFLAAHMERTVTMDDAAAHMGLSKDYFGKTCKQKTGLAFGALYARVKVEHAKALLESGQYKAYEISEMLGYSSPDYFTRIFREVTGMTPTQYRSGMGH